MPPTVSVTGWYFRCGHVGTGEDPEVLGDVHPIFSCDINAKGLRVRLSAALGMTEVDIAGPADIAFLINLYEDFL